MAQVVELIWGGVVVAFASEVRGVDGEEAGAIGRYGVGDEDIIYLRPPTRIPLFRNLRGCRRLQVGAVGNRRSHRGL